MMTVVWNRDLTLPRSGILDYPDDYFDAVYADYDLSSEFVDRVVETIDKSPRIQGTVFDSPFLGTIGPSQLAGGSKALFMILNNEFAVKKYSSTCFGNNCLPFLLELSFTHDFTIVFEHVMGMAVCKGQPVCAQTEDGIAITDVDLLFEFCVSGTCKGVFKQ